MAPRTDWAGVSTPSLNNTSVSAFSKKSPHDWPDLITMETPNTPRPFKRARATAEFSINVRTPLFTGFISDVK